MKLFPLGGAVLHLRSITLLFLLMLGGTVATAQQNANIIGRVLDSTGLAVPGASITVRETVTGRQFTTVTNDGGEYRVLNLPPGKFRVEARAEGFRPGAAEVEILVGQAANVPFTLEVGSITESVSVSAEALLVDVSTSQVGGNVDRRQMEHLPLAGRNWMELSLQVKGITANSVDQRPGVERDEQFQLNLDGQQVTQKNAASSFGQPKFSREAIAEFQISTNMFDITQGRSTVSQVQAISKSGTNDLHGSAYAYLRDDSMNAADPVANRVLPYSNQQIGGSIGGAIVKDKLHYFGTYEYERQPNTLFVQPNLLTGQSYEFQNTIRDNSTLVRVDHTASDRDRFNYRFSQWNTRRPFDVSATAFPGYGGDRTRKSYNALGTWARVLGASSVQELKIGYNHFSWANAIVAPELNNTPLFRFTSVNIGASRDWPSGFDQNLFSARYDFTTLKGRHEIKFGAEYLHWIDTGEWHLMERGEFIFTSNPPDLTTRFPASAWNNPSAWNLTGLEQYVQRYDQSFGDYNIRIPRPTVALWIGDNWRIHDRLTLNLGLRWDDDWGATAVPDSSSLTTTIFGGGRLFKSDIRDHNNIAPRIGFAFRPTAGDDFVIRGGSGFYYGTAISNIVYGQQQNMRLVTASFPYDGLPGFIQDPTRGVTGEQILSGAVPLPALAPRVVAHDFKMPYTIQNALGFSKQVGSSLVIESDLIHWRSLRNPIARDLNLFYDPVTGYNRNPNTGRPDPAYSQIQFMESTANADYMALASSITRRFNGRFQAGLTHTVMFYKNDNSNSFQITANNSFDYAGEWSRSTDFQRNTIRAHALFNLPWGFNLSGMYGYGSGNYYTTTIAGSPYGKPGSNRLNVGNPITVLASTADRFDGPSVIGTGEVAPRNALKGFPLHKVDLRLAKVIPLGEKLRISVQGELFNALNHRNFGAYNSVINTTTFGEPRQNQGNGYLPRTGQIGIRLDF